jgi:hypothetical protein
MKAGTRELAIGGDSARHRFTQINDHDHGGLHSGSKERDEANPYGN